MPANSKTDSRSATYEDGTFPVSPHLDFAFRYADGRRVGVECKLHEPYGRLDHQPLRRAYLDLTDAWVDIPAWRALAENLAGPHPPYRGLARAQLVKHLLGLKHGPWRRRSGSCTSTLTLRAPRQQSTARNSSRSSQPFKGDPIRFQALTVQEFIVRAVHKVRAEHRAYVDYLAERYL